MLNYVHLQNFKRHADLRVDFAAGVTAITGPNFGGKTTILDAVAFAFAGPRAVPGGADVCLKRGAETFSVAVGFTVNGDGYTVKRSKSTATLWKGDTAVAKSASAVTTALQELLGLDQKRFGQLKMARQKQTEALLTTGVTELHQIIEEVSGADVVSKVLDKASGLSTACKSALEVIPDEDPTAARNQQDQTSTELKDVEQLLTPAQDQVDTCRQTLQKAKEALTSANTHNREQAALRQAASRATSEHDMLHKQAKELQVELASHGDLPDLEELKASVTSLTQEENEQISLARELSVLDRQLSSAAQTALSAQADVDRSEAELDGVPAVDLVELDRLKADREEKADGLKLAELALRAHLDVSKSAVCPTCHRAMEGHDSELLAKEQAKLEGAIAAWKFTLEPVKLRVEELSNRAHQRQRLEERLEGAKRRHQEAEQKVKEARAESAKLGVPLATEERKQLRTCLAAATVALDSANRQQAVVEQLAGRLGRIDQRLSELVVELAGLQEPKPDIEVQVLEQAVDAADKASTTAGSQLTDLKMRLVHLEANLKSATDRLLHVEQQAEQRRNWQQRKDRLDRLTKYLRDNRDRFMSEVWAGVTAYAGEFASACTGGAISALQREESGDFTYLENGDVFPVDAASGAQRSILGLGIQIALDQLLPSPFHTLLLDEATADMSPEVSMAATAQLQSLGSQVVLVTHRELDGSVADQVVAL